MSMICKEGSEGRAFLEEGPLVQGLDGKETSQGQSSQGLESQAECLRSAQQPWGQGLEARLQVWKWPDHGLAGLPLR